MQLTLIQEEDRKMCSPGCSFCDSAVFFSCSALLLDAHVSLVVLSEESDTVAMLWVFARRNRCRGHYSLYRNRSGPVAEAPGAPISGAYCGSLMC
jgi:hypothetical protein